MEPAMTLCAGIAAVTLALGVAGAAGGAARRLSALRIPLPVRPLATLLTLVTLLPILLRTRPASAAVAPPIVRLEAEPGAAPPPAAPEPDAVETADAVVRDDSGPAPSPAGNEYVVRKGDCLWRIARRALTERSGHDPTNAEVARFWPVIYAANRDLIGDDPNLIFPGQRFTIPER